MHQHHQQPEQEIFLLHPLQRPCTANNASQFSTVAKNDAVPNLTPQVPGGRELYTARRMLNTAYRPQRYGVAGATHAKCSAPGRNYKPALKNSCARPGVNHFFVAPSGNLAQTARQPNAKYAHDREHQRRQREQQSTHLANFGNDPMNHDQRVSKRTRCERSQNQNGSSCLGKRRHRRATQ